MKKVEVNFSTETFRFTMRFTDADNNVEVVELDHLEAIDLVRELNREVDTKILRQGPKLTIVRGGA